MKKILPVLSIFLLAVLSSCATIPQKVKPGDTLVIGNATIEAFGFENTGLGKLSGTIHTGIEITFQNTTTKKERTIRTDSDGNFFLSGLTANQPHRISKVSIKVEGGGGSTTHTVTFTNSEVFIPYDNTVTNIGCTKYIFDGFKNEVRYECRDHYKMRVAFKDISEDSEWADKTINDQCGLR